MDVHELILEYLTFHPSKSCTILSLTLLFRHYSVDTKTLIDAVFNLYLENKVSIVENQYPFMTEIKLIPKLSLI